MEYTIRKADTPELYGELRGLWCDVFGDPPEFVDTLYDTFGSDAAGYVVTDENGKAVSALTCYKCGVYELPPSEDEYEAEYCASSSEPLPVYVSYAICTAPEYRGKGMAGRLTSYVKDLVLSEGGISIVSPASEDLAAFYENLGYKHCFTAAEMSAFAEMASGFGPDWEEDEDDFDDYEPFEPELSVMRANEALYNAYREAFLAGKPHIALSGEMMELVRRESADGDGLLIINGGDAICVLADDGQKSGEAYAAELLVNPMLSDISFEIEGEIAARLARHLEAFVLTYRSDGQAKLQSMIAAADGVPYREGSYYGFPVD